MGIVKNISFTLLSLLILLTAISNRAISQDNGNKSGDTLFARENLLAWCIVPYDASERGPEDRAEMLNELGITKMAWDWRERHLNQLPEEIETLREHNIDLSAVWLWVDKRANDGFTETHKYILNTLEEYDVNTTIWIGFNKNFFEGLSDKEKVEKGANFVEKVYNRANSMNCDVALYNHGNWMGNPKNQIRVIEKIGKKDIGIVYNFHHAHHQIEQFPELLETMMPYLKIVNLNGMKPDGPMILPIGEGTEEAQMIETLKESGFSGNIGILDHDHDVDSKVRLQKNLEGLQKIVEQTETGK